MKRSLVSSLPAGEFCSLERDFFPSLKGGKLHAYCEEGRFIDIGTPEAYAMAESFFAVKSDCCFAKDLGSGLLPGKEAKK